MGWGASYPSFHCDQLGGRCILMCVHFGLGARTLLLDFLCKGLFPSDTPRGAWRFTKLKTQELTLALRGGVGINLVHMAE